MPPVITHPPPSTVATELGMLEQEERALSWRRRELHAEIDRLYLAAPLTGDQIALLDRLEGEERMISTRRQTLHREIDGRRAGMGLPTGPGFSTST
jgi:hypothetical protein